MNCVYIINNNTNKNLSYKIKNIVFNKLKDKYNEFNYKIVYTIPTDNNSIYYFLKKKYDNKLLEEIKKNNNYLIYEPLDIDWDKYKTIKDYIENNLNYFNLFDEIICNNNNMAIKLKEFGYNKNLSVI